MVHLVKIISKLFSEPRRFAAACLVLTMASHVSNVTFWHFTKVSLFFG